MPITLEIICFNGIYTESAVNVVPKGTIALPPLYHLAPYASRKTVFDEKRKKRKVKY